MYSAINFRVGLEIDMTQVEQLADFVGQAKYDNLSQEAREELKIRVLEALGCAIGALEGPTMAMLRTHLQEIGGITLTTRIGGGQTAPDRTPFYKTVLV